MSLFKVSVLVGHRHTAPFIVDTGATFSVIPGAVLDALGVEPTGTRKVRFADGEALSLRFGNVDVSVGDRTAAMVPVLFGHDPETFLLGASALDALGLVPDTARTRLVDADCVFACPTIVDRA